MGKILIYGILASFFFSITFALNKWLSLDGHWYWTAFLRYLYVLMTLTLLLIFFYGWNSYKDTIKCFLKFKTFWIVAGGVGYGLFYLAICYAAPYASAWVLAATWQITILMSPLVFYILRQNVPIKGIFYLVIMLSGIVLINLEEFKGFSFNLHFIIPLVLASFFYPLGNTLCKYATEGKFPKFRIDNYPISKNIFSQITMMTLGAFPIFIAFWFFLSPPNPTSNQLYFILIIAFLTGVVATSLLYKARQIAKNDTYALTAADGMQAAEPPFTFFWEFILFNGRLPSVLGIIGLFLVISGIFSFYFFPKSKIRK